jgi:hypothetical protein
MISKHKMSFQFHCNRNKEICYQYLTCEDEYYYEQFDVKWCSEINFSYLPLPIMYGNLEQILNLTNRNFGNDFKHCT